MFDIRAICSMYDISYIVCLSVRLGATLAINNFEVFMIRLRFRKPLTNKTIRHEKLKWFFSRTTEPISSKLGTKHPWVTGIQVCSNERTTPLSKGILGWNIKNTWTNSKIFSWTTGPISNKRGGTKYPWVTGIQVCSNKGQRPFPRRHNYEVEKYIVKF